MRLSRRNLTRLVALGSAAAIVGVPIVLMASTWDPLEPAPRDSSDQETEQPERPRRKDRQDEAERTIRWPLDEQAPTRALDL